MSRNRLFLVAGSLAVAAAVSLISGITLLNRDVGSYIASHYRQESRDVNGTRYLCTGSPKQVATTLVKYQTPAARASHTDTELPALPQQHRDGRTRRHLSVHHPRRKPQRRI